MDGTKVQIEDNIRKCSDIPDLTTEYTVEHGFQRQPNPASPVRCVIVNGPRT